MIRTTAGAFQIGQKSVGGSHTIAGHTHDSINAFQSPNDISCYADLSTLHESFSGFENADEKLLWPQLPEIKFMLIANTTFRV